MRRLTHLVQRGLSAIEDLELLKILESELNHELSSMLYKDDKVSTLGDFVLEYDSPLSRDVLLRKKCSRTGEEVAVSALLGRETTKGDGEFPMEASMKISVKKPHLSSIFLFDCKASRQGGGESEFEIQDARYIPSSSLVDSLIYKGRPPFSELDPALQHELKRYLAARGIDVNLTNFVLHHLHKKEHAQYMDWLQKLKNMMMVGHE